MAAASGAPLASSSSCQEQVATLLHVVDSVVERCPWTQVKTAAQLCMYTKSEVAEIEEELAASAHGEDKTAAIVGEVGDLLFDVLLLARIVERDFPGATVGNMLKGVAEKVRRRCPQVFAGEHCETPAEAAEIWKREKAKEKVQEVLPAAAAAAAAAEASAAEAAGGDRPRQKRPLNATTPMVKSNEDSTKKPKLC